MAVRRLFVLRALGLGDFLTGVPAYRALKRAFPEHRLTLATDPALAPLARLVGAIDELVPGHGPAEFTRPSSPPGVAVNLHGRGPQSTRALAGLRPARLIAFDAGDAAPVWRDDEHEVARWCRLLRESGLDADPNDLLLAEPPARAAVPAAAVVHPGAAYASRRWPPERFAVVARGLAARGHAVVVTGSASERALAAHIAALAGLPPSAVLACETGLLELAALVSSARLVVSGDTGAAHLATAFATPSVTLFGPIPPSRWGPPDGPHVALWHGRDGGATGNPWGLRIDPRLLDISVDEVLDACARLPDFTGRRRSA